MITGDTSTRSLDCSQLILRFQHPERPLAAHKKLKQLRRCLSACVFDFSIVPVSRVLHIGAACLLAPRPWGYNGKNYIPELQNVCKIIAFWDMFRGTLNPKPYTLKP